MRRTGMGKKARFAIILTLVALASFAVVYDRIGRSADSNVDLGTQTTTYATSTASPPTDPAAVLSHPSSP